MKRLNRRKALKAATVLGVTAIGAASAVADTNAGEEPRKVNTFTGRVDELGVDLLIRPDPKVTWCQVILNNGEERLAAVTHEGRLQTLLELAFATGKDVEVSYNEAFFNHGDIKTNVKSLTRVKVARGTGGK